MAETYEKRASAGKAKEIYIGFKAETKGYKALEKVRGMGYTPEALRNIVADALEAFIPRLK